MLSISDKKYITEHYGLLKPFVIAKHIGKSTKDVKDYIKENELEPVQKQEAPAETIPLKAEKPQFLRMTTGGVPGVTISTQGASELSDAIAPKGNAKKDNSHVRKMY